MFDNRFRLVVMAVVATVFWGMSVSTWAEEASTRGSKIDFNRDIRPILSNSCFLCHGPDEENRKADLRLDTKDGALADLGGYAAILPGSPEESELIYRIEPDDPSELMPPRKSGKSLTEREIRLLRQWIAEGASYAEHWSYEPPVRPIRPEVRNTAWPRSEIDRFILARLEREGVSPAPEADRHALGRRVALDLTGLPPTPEEVEALVQDPEPDAYERYVDRQLAKPSYGEHMARLWLDLARYADSAGYADDPPRTIWAYRDWVIRAFNHNMPFDQFTIEQLAGDLLPTPTDDQLIATAFHRNTMTNSEGGTNDEEFRNVAIVDRVNTTWTVWLGTSMACAQCHNHKYDPISQRDFFRFFAFLNNTEDADRRDEAPVLEIHTDAQKRRLAELRGEIAQREAVLQTPTAAITDAQALWEKNVPREVSWRPASPTDVRSEGNAELIPQEDGSILVGKGPATDTLTVKLPLGETPVTALRLDVLPDDSLPGRGPGKAANGNFVISQIQAVLRTPEGQQSETPFEAAFADYEQAGFKALQVLGDKEPAQTGWAIAGATGQAHHLSLIPKAPITGAEGSVLIVTIKQRYKEPDHTLGRFRLSATTDPRAAEYVRIPAAILALLGGEPGQRSQAEQTAVRDYFLSIAPELRPTRDRLATLRKELADLKPTTSVPILRELPEGKRRVTRIQLRGNYLDTADEVTQGLPEALPPLPTDAPRNRLTLARWIVDPNNPLTPRVIANRCWEQIFGMGLVRTSEEFGSQGELPSHPELLDWLATELVRDGWDLKRFLKRLVTSATYRQSTKAGPGLVEADPENRLHARGPRFRISAEVVRDQALFVSGLLSDKMYGPPVNPPRPRTGLNAAFGSAIDRETSQGADRYRRALYTEWRRTNPYPSMTTFDAPNRDVCTVRRNRTNTPLQALVTLNDPVYIEAAQALARRLVAGATSAEDRARLGMRLCLLRPATDAEIARLVQLYQQAKADYQHQPAQAKAIATDPLGPAPDGVDEVELASWTVVSNVLLNLDEMFLKR
jgi:hypothetical protein